MTASQLATAGDCRRSGPSSSRRFEQLADADRTGPIDHLSIDKVVALIPTLPSWSVLTRTRKRYQIDGARTILEWKQDETDRHRRPRRPWRRGPR